jgi:hypothetical protein
MSTPSLAILLCSLALFLTTSAHAQYGYAPQGAVPPPAGQGIAGAPAAAPGQTLLPTDPNMGMGAPGSYVDASAYGGQPGYGAQPAYAGQANYMGQPGYAPMGAMTTATGSMLTYGQLELNYNYTDFDNESVDPASGIGLDIMAELFNPFFIHGGFNWGMGSEAGDKKDEDSYNFRTVSIGGGVHFAITPNLYFVGELGGIYSSLNADKSSLSFTDGAVYIHPQLRFAATDKLEVKAGVLLTSADDYDSKVFDIGGYYKLFTQMDLGLGADIGDQSKNYHLGVRFRW